MTTLTMKITRKGQVTIPKEIRKKLTTEFVYFEIKGDVVLVKPVRDAAGMLREFAGKAKQGVSMNKKKSKAWDVSVQEKTGKKG